MTGVMLATEDPATEKIPCYLEFSCYPRTHLLIVRISTVRIYIHPTSDRKIYKTYDFVTEMWPFKYLSFKYFACY